MAIRRGSLGAAAAGAAVVSGARDRSSGGLILPASLADRVESASGLVLLPILALFVIAVLVARRAR